MKLELKDKNLIISDNAKVVCTLSAEFSSINLTDDEGFGYNGNCGMSLVHNDLTNDEINARITIGLAIAFRDYLDILDNLILNNKQELSDFIINSMWHADAPIKSLYFDYNSVHCKKYTWFSDEVYFIQNRDKLNPKAVAFALNRRVGDLVLYTDNIANGFRSSNMPRIKVESRLRSLLVRLRNALGIDNNLNYRNELICIFKTMPREFPLGVPKIGSSESPVSLYNFLKSYMDFIINKNNSDENSTKTLEELMAELETVKTSYNYKVNLLNKQISEEKARLGLK